MTARVAAALLWLGALCPPARAGEPVALGDRRVLFVDKALVERSSGLELRLHPPRPRETVMTFDAPWEGSGSDFERIIKDGDTIRLYYMATELTSTDGLRRGDGTVRACYAESRDGVHWHRPDLGLREFQGSRHNNIIWTEPHLDNFTPFRDANPACLPAERYKATASNGSGLLFGLVSPDGIRWSQLSDQPMMTHGRFDTQNNAFWDSVRNCYFCYIRGFHDQAGRTVEDSRHGTVGIRDIRVSTSQDFRHWSEPRRLDFGDAPDEALYTNQVEPYYRAPDLLVGFPTRYVDRNFSAAAMAALPDPVHRERRMALSHRYGSVVTDGLFMASHDGYHFHRWDEPFIPPGPQRSNNWVYGDGYQSLGLVETQAEDPTAAPELSCYVDEGHWKDGETLRRYTLRIDGFASLHAKREPGEFLTPPFIFAGRTLHLNLETSAAGSIRVELEDAAGLPYPGRTLGDCDELFGDTPDRTVTWSGSPSVASWAGRPVRLRVALSEADLYALRFEH